MDQRRKPLFCNTPLMEFTFEKLRSFRVFPPFFLFRFLFSPFSLLSPRDQIRRSRPLQPTELISLRQRGAIRAAEAGDVPVRHLINSLIAAGQKEDPFLRIGESGRQRYRACLRGPPRPRQSVSVCAAPEKGARAPCLVKQSQRARPPRRADRTFFIRS